MDIGYLEVIATLTLFQLTTLTYVCNSILTQLKKDNEQKQDR